MFFESLCAIIHLVSGIPLSSEVCGTAVSSSEGRVVPGTGGEARHSKAQYWKVENWGKKGEREKIVNSSHGKGIAASSFLLMITILR